MPAQMKRPAAAAFKGKAKHAAAEPRAKRQHEDPTTSKVDAVVKMLLSADGYPTEVPQMLAGCVRTCLAVPKEERHEVQHEVINMIGEVLASVEARYAEQAGEAQRRLAEASEDKTRREAGAEAAEVLRKDQAEAVATASQALEAAKAQTCTAQAELATASASQEVAGADFATREAKKTSAEAIFNTQMSALKEGTAANVEKAMIDIITLGKDLGIEEQVLAAGGIALEKIPAARSSFDGMVVGQVDDYFRTAIGKLVQEAAGAASMNEQCLARVDECRRVEEASIVAAEACKAQLEAAETTMQEREGDKSAADEAARDAGLQVEEAKVVAEAAQEPGASSREVLGLFRELVELSSTPQEPAAPVDVVVADVHADAAIATTADAPVNASAITEKVQNAIVTAGATMSAVAVAGA